MPCPLLSAFMGFTDRNEYSIVNFNLVCYFAWCCVFHKLLYYIEQIKIKKIRCKQHQVHKYDRHQCRFIYNALASLQIAWLSSIWAMLCFTLFLHSLNSVKAIFFVQNLVESMNFSRMRTLYHQSEWSFFLYIERVKYIIQVCRESNKWEGFIRF